MMMAESVARRTAFMALPFAHALVQRECLNAALPLRRRRRRRHVRRLLTMAHRAALASGFARLIHGPFVCAAFLVRGFSALARDLPLLLTIHRCKATILFRHESLLPIRLSRRREARLPAPFVLRRSAGYAMTRMTTRRFCARPAAVLFDATGFSMP